MNLAQKKKTITCSVHPVVEVTITKEIKMPFQCSWLGMVVSSEQTESSKQKAQLEAHTELPTHRVLMCGVSNMYYNASVLVCVCSKSVTVWITFSIRHCKESSGRNGHWSWTTRL